ncbi:YraN family protein [candidate division GN15 bacterium]|uniref:UPF0102 protein C3F09_09600 n=1 Tax=candidate division GN15 bacterium TaxID=2072418 RepID=A0A855WYQ6_9BACT|nr:MAG: YraN family protein [candidate division GN15 bacterium]
MPSSKRKAGGRASRLSRGHAYERAAEKIFRDQGFDVLERNWRTGHKEIDLIVRRRNLLVFVEVKSARTASFGHPAEWVDKRKVENLTTAALTYIQKNEITDCDLRFDVVAFVCGRPEHYPDAFGVE